MQNWDIEAAPIGLMIIIQKPRSCAREQTLKASRGSDPTVQNTILVAFMLEIPTVLLHHPAETRGMTCIFMPLSQDIVMERCSAALTPSGPPICSISAQHLRLVLLRMTDLWQLLEHALKNGSA